MNDHAHGDAAARRKWDRAARSFDFMTGIGADMRWGPYKRELFSHMRGRVLFLALGTGLDIEFFPPGREITAIDISPRMLDKAAPRVAAYDGDIDAREMSVHDMPFEAGSFDQVYTSCTFCSVPRPVAGLQALRRILKPGGELRMFEHTGSRWFPMRQMLNVMNPLARRGGPEVNRDTVANVEAAGFDVKTVDPVYLDVVKMITATAPAAAQPDR
jgi:ubiquinone/menaquinone biosynthesis C-methylase UbiE